ncbi:hypothetical protein LSH36_2758g00000 [Paralvinella palmiformis]|uniref:Macro domain-containing protein n=1 Tax=Paralvinella palmiformis TaxID=53620 RepID=A0AAD9IQL6_9ANNE|nr:hypothetical protein LSH36_2758g00000 [Paralvinella palmiformis]
MTFGNDNLLIVKIGDLEQENVDVILNVTREDLYLDCGGVSGAILKAAGQVVQEQCNLFHPELLKPGEIFVTLSGALPTKAIFHGYCTEWDNGECHRTVHERNTIENSELLGDWINQQAD